MEVLDENDNTPLTELPVYYPSVPENSPAGVSVLQIQAFDRDASPQQFTFSISSGNPAGYFLINSTTGKFHSVIHIVQPSVHNRVGNFIYTFIYIHILIYIRKHASTFVRADER